jgi:uncharacterized protein
MAQQSMLTSIAQVPEAAGIYRVRLPVTTDLNDADISIWVHAIVGAKPGPTLTLLSGAHGNEWGHIEWFARFLSELQPQALSGRILVVPVANSVSLGQLRRAVPDDSDMPDVNRSFPGKGRKFTWIAEQIATVLAEEVLAASDALLEFHVGIWGSAMGSSIVGNGYSRPDINDGCRDLALAFGIPLVFHTNAVAGFPGPRSALGYTGEVRGIPASGSMLGGTGFDRDQEAGWAEANLRGIRNTLVHLGMLEGRMQLPERYLFYATVHRVNPRVGGLVLPERVPDEFGRPVAKDELLGRVLSPYRLETLEELRSPFDGYLAYWCRSYPVRPGDWTFGVIPTDDPGTRWVDRPNWANTSSLP